MTSDRPFLALDPGVCNGQPTIGRSRLYVRVVAEAWWFGGMEEHAIYSNWPSCAGRAELLLACWWMARYGTSTWRKRWGTWLQEAAGELWRGNYDIDLPPRIAPDPKAG